jgi:hypothetical protein
MEPNIGYVVAGYAITAVALGGYALRLFVRARRARERSDAVAEGRRV